MSMKAILDQNDKYTSSSLSEITSAYQRIDFEIEDLVMQGFLEPEVGELLRVRKTKIPIIIGIPKTQRHIPTTIPTHCVSGSVEVISSRCLH